MELSKTSSSSAGAVELLASTAAPAGDEGLLGIDFENFAKITSRLTDIYTNPVAATVRELMSNALDATMLLPEEERKPVEVTLPHEFSQHFVVRDWGVGMTFAMVKSYYMKFGGSTKEHDITQVGSHGLGCKAPLAYTSAYHVVTVREGVKTSFTIAKSSAGPTYSDLRTEPTDELPGTVVTVPIRPQDVNKFEDAMRSYKDFSFDVPVLVSDVLYKDNSDYVHLQDYVQHEASGLTGRVWARKLGVLQHFKNFVSSGYNSLRQPYQFALRGWVYDAQEVDYGKSSQDFMLELKPAVVEFTSSRDAITKNGRLSTLNELVARQLFSSEEFALSSLVNVHPKLSSSEAFSFFKTMRPYVGALEKASSDSQGFVIFGSSRQVRVPLTALTSAEGDNFFALLLDDSYELDTLAAFKLNESDFSVAETKSIYSPTLYDKFCSLELNSISVKRYKEHLLKVTGGVHSSVKLLTTLSPSHQEERLKALVLTEVTSEQLEVFFRGRAVLHQHFYPGYIFLLTEKKELSQVSKNLIATLPYVSLEERSLSSLLKEVASTKRRLSSEKKAREESEVVKFELRQLTSGLADEVALSESTRWAYSLGNTTTISLNELKNERAIIIAADEAYQRSEVLFGVVNAGIKDIYNRPIYAVPKGYGKLTTKQLKALEEWPHLYIHADSTHRTKLGVKLLEGRTYKGRMLNSVLSQVTDETVLGCYIVNSLPNYMITPYSSELLQEVSGSKELKGHSLKGFFALLEEYNNESYYKLDRITAQTEVIARRGEDFHEAFQVVMEVVGFTHRDATFANVVTRAFMSSQEPEEELKDSSLAIAESIVTRILQKTS